MSSPVEPTLIVLKGKTGSGKTDLLHLLSHLHYPVIDIESIANHRGSVFGAIGINEPQPDQQSFEQKIFDIYREFYLNPFVFTEFEAGAVGKRKIPAWFYKKMQEGVQVELHVSKKRRSDRIVQEYFSGKLFDDAYLQATDKLSQRLPKEKIFLLKEMITSKNYPAFVDNILDYYDNALHYSSNCSNTFIDVHAEDNTDTACIAGCIIQALQQKGIVLIS